MFLFLISCFSKNSSNLFITFFLYAGGIISAAMDGEKCAENIF